MKYNKKHNTRAIFLLLAIMSSSAYSANWLMIQGTELPTVKAKPVAPKVFGLLQTEYVKTDNTKVKAGPFTGREFNLNQNPPSLTSSEGINIKRATIGVRGKLPADENINYFLLAGAVVKTPGNSSRAVKILDASASFNHIEGARIRVGQFKHPSAEEAMQIVPVQNYNNFSNATNQLLLERFFDGTGAAPNTSLTNTNAQNGPVSIFRDIGVQVFDTFKQDNGWEYSYAVMLGNGNGIARSDNNDKKDVYLYLSTEKVYKGKGPKRQGLKLFAWKQQGERTLIKEGAGDYDRERSGLGLTFREGKYRFITEYITADGMIFNGADAAVPGSVATSGPKPSGLPLVSTWNLLPEGKADGYYLDFGYKIAKNIELDLRYDVLNRLTDNSLSERKFTSTTLGAKYLFNKNARLSVNYEFRDIKAPGNSSSVVQDIISTLDDRISAQLTLKF